MDCSKYLLSVYLHLFIADAAICEDAPPITRYPSGSASNARTDMGLRSLGRIYEHLRTLWGRIDYHIMGKH